MSGDRFTAGLDAVKRIPFHHIAARWGYHRDPGASTPNAPVLRAEGQPKLVLKLCANGHWVYFNSQDEADNGTAVDFLLNRGLTFAEIRNLVRTPGSSGFLETWQQAASSPFPEHLARRGITAATVDAYKPLIRSRQNGQVLFAHRNHQRVITGFEIDPPHGPRRFATGGQRALFVLCAEPASRISTLVITESAIDALSLAQIDQCPPGTVFLSTAGMPSKRQCRHIQFAASTLTGVQQISLAQDADAGGDRQASLITRTVTIPKHVTWQRRRPPENLDWNDVVRQTSQAT